MKSLILFTILSVSAVSSLPEVDSDGWIAVAKPSSEGVAEMSEEDSSIWVVFSKQAGPEKILISFPEEPSYFYRENGEMEIFTYGNGNDCRLQILKKVFVSPEEIIEEREGDLEGAIITNMGSRLELSSPVVEWTYWKEGFWHQEKWISTKYHTYFFHTKTPSRDLAFHREFVESFDVEIDRHFSS